MKERIINMKRILTTLFAVVLLCATATAQRAEIQKAAQRYRNVNTVTATVTQTRHNAAVTKDAVATGKFYFKRPEKHSMVFSKTKEMLLFDGTSYIMARNGKQRKAKASVKGANPFEVLKEVFGNLISGSSTTQLSKCADVKLTRQGNIGTITITPNITDSKAKRRLMYTSCVVTVDIKAAEVRRVLINERGKNYTRYDFSDFHLNGEVSNNVFNVKTAL